MRKRNGNRLGASSQKKLHVHLVDEKAMDDEILTMVVELKLVQAWFLGFGWIELKTSQIQLQKKRNIFYRTNFEA